MKRSPDLMFHVVQRGELAVSLLALGARLATIFPMIVRRKGRPDQTQEHQYYLSSLLERRGRHHVPQGIGRNYSKQKESCQSVRILASSTVASATEKTNLTILMGRFLN
jgi:hypothetical protein